VERPGTALAEQKLPLMARLTVDDHLTVSTALAQLITAAERRIATRTRPNVRVRSPSQTHNAGT